MNTVKILHCADLHLDSPMLFPKGVTAPVTKQDLRLCFEDICQKARDCGAKIMLISGDLFNNTSCTPATVTFLGRLFREYGDIRFFICTGNHDYYSGKSVYALANFPENVYVFKSSTPERVILEDLGVCVHGVGCTAEHCSERYMQKAFSPMENMINILLYHGALVSQRGENEYYPFTEEDVAASGMDYVALGHIHTHGGIHTAGSTYYAYPGIPQGRGFDELDHKGVLLGDVGKNICNLEFVTTCRKRFGCIEIDVSDCRDNGEVGKKALSAAGDNNFLRVILKGEAGFTVVADEVKSYLENLSFVQVTDGTYAAADIDVLAEERSLTGLFVKELNKLGEQDDEVFRLALKYGLAALRGEEIQL